MSLDAVSAQTVAWSQSEASSLRRFLRDNPRFIEVLRSRLPEVSMEGMERAALTGAAKEGGEKILREILLMSGNDADSDSTPFIGNE